MTITIIVIAIILAGYFFLKSKNEGDVSNEYSLTNINTQEAKEMIKHGKVKVIDVRTPMEVSRGKIKQAIHINVNNTSFRDEVSSFNKDQEYILYCRSGRRSVQAGKIMGSEGFKKLYNLEGGYNAWN